MSHSRRPRRKVSIQALVLRSLLPSLVVLSVVLASLVYQRLSDSILDTFTRELKTVSALAAALIDPADQASLTAIARQPGIDAPAVEKTAPYLRNAQPLRDIRRALGLTYVYTQVLGAKGGDLFYVVDGTEGSEHSPIGQVDTTTPRTLAGLKRIQTQGGVYISPIEFQEKWGLLKTGAAAIRDAEGRSIGATGADLNISIIRVATEQALFRSAVLAVVTAIGAALASWLIAVRLADPILRLHAAALKAAAGGDTEVDLTHIGGAREIGSLQRSLERMILRMDTVRRTRREADEQVWTRAVVAELDGPDTPADAALRIDDGARRIVGFPPPELDATDAAIWRRGLRELVRSAADDALLVRALAPQPGGLAVKIGDRTHLLGTQPPTVDGAVARSADGRTAALEP